MPAPIRPLPITTWTATSALGHGRTAHQAAIRERRSGLVSNDFTRVPLACAIGRVAGVEETSLPGEFSSHDCRNNRLAWMGLQNDGFLDAAMACIARNGADRVGLIVGTSTASIGFTEEAWRNLDNGHLAAGYRLPNLHTPHSLGLFLAAALGIRGPSLSVATACSSSARIFAKAERLIRLGICDAVVLAGFALLERDADAVHPRLAGYGESSDAHHMSTPHPEGLGARLAMTQALARAGCEPHEVDYINLHGTATPKNDEIEAIVVNDLFPATTRASSTKGWTGHTLGAAGILETVLTLGAMQDGMIPGTLNCEESEPRIAANLALDNEPREIRLALSNSFGFGGSNCSLVFARGRP